ncbi:MAG: FKBP-type peptidyl-prolyl cis-trans isomerase [Candidatus Azobacteroides sp.]|nr:FKBP-type peptidyl-prolyl cis-trans isomerase [Candidatus Azobacteroides sp.]
MEQNRLNKIKRSVAGGLVGAFLFLLAACNSGSSSSEQWKANNDDAYNQIKKNSNWALISTPEGPTGVYCQVLVAGKGDEHPIQTASVTVNYTGKYYTGTVFDSGTSVTFNVNGVVIGLGVALQNMVVGDKWNVCIPYYLGYGASIYSSIQAYTTLFFEVELLKINQYP